jgi:hypothetical protein
MNITRSSSSKLFSVLNHEIIRNGIQRIGIGFSLFFMKGRRIFRSLQLSDTALINAWNSLENSVKQFLIALMFFSVHLSDVFVNTLFMVVQVRSNEWKPCSICATRSENIFLRWLCAVRKLWRLWPLTFAFHLNDMIDEGGSGMEQSP